MRQEFLADIAEYYNCMAPNIAGAQQPAYANKLAKMKSVIQRLSVSHPTNCIWAHIVDAEVDALLHGLVACQSTTRHR